MKYEEQKRLIVEFLHNSEKRPEDFLIGAELEFFVIEKKSFRSINYFEENGIKQLLQDLVNKGYSPLLDGDDIVGAQSPDLMVTLEPGAQFEISLAPRKTIFELEQEYLNFINLIDPILEKRGQRFFSSGYHPVTKIDELPFIPKKRYKFMSEYLSKKGDMALNMMKGTASIQVAIDYSSEADFHRKMLLASKLTPVLSAVYDNSSVFEGEKYQRHNLRTLIWNNCDNDRCGVIRQIFDPDSGYEKYAEYILEQIPIFIFKNGEMTKFEKQFKYIFDPNDDIDYQLNHIFSMCFPDVRARHYIELRMTDSLPYPLNFAYLELIRKLFYDNNILTEVGELLENISFKDVVAFKKESIRYGVKAELKGVTILSIFQKILAIIGNFDNGYFHLNNKIASTGNVPRKLFRG
jgi:glutamate--cysteine ligase